MNYEFGLHLDLVGQVKPGARDKIIFIYPYISVFGNDCKRNRSTKRFMSDGTLIS